MTPRRLLVLAASTALALGSCSGDDGGEGAERATSTTTGAVASTTTTVAAPNVTLAATLTGAEEAPGPGASGGTGRARVEIQPAAGQLCYDITVTMPEGPTVAHIHEGAKGASGPVLVDLAPVFRQAESAWISQGCVGPATGKERVAADPPAFYLNVHSKEHPAGAVRGQLAIAPG